MPLKSLARTNFSRPVVSWSFPPPSCSIALTENVMVDVISQVSSFILCNDRSQDNRQGQLHRCGCALDKQEEQEQEEQEEQEKRQVEKVQCEFEHDCRCRLRNVPGSIDRIHWQHLDASGVSTCSQGWDFYISGHRRRCRRRRR